MKGTYLSMEDAEKIAKFDCYKNECYQQGEVIKSKNREIKRLMKENSDNQNKIKDAKDYINFLVILLNNGTQVKFKNTQWGQELLWLLGEENE